MLAALRADSAVNYLCKVVILDLAHIARDVETGIVVVVLVSAASEVGGALERIVEENRYVLGQTDGAYEAGMKSALIGDNCGMNRLT